MQIYLIFKQKENVKVFRPHAAHNSGINIHYGRHCFIQSFQWVFASFRNTNTNRSMQRKKGNYYKLSLHRHLREPVMAG